MRQRIERGIHDPVNGGTVAQGHRNCGVVGGWNPPPPSCKFSRGPDAACASFVIARLRPTIPECEKPQCIFAPSVSSPYSRSARPRWPRRTMRRGWRQYHPCLAHPTLRCATRQGLTIRRRRPHWPPRARGSRRACEAGRNGLYCPWEGVPWGIRTPTSAPGSPRREVPRPVQRRHAGRRAPSCACGDRTRRSTPRWQYQSRGGGSQRGRPRCFRLSFSRPYRLMRTPV